MKLWTIRNAQLAAFAAQAEAQFVERMAAELHERFPARFASPDESLRAYVRGELQAARKFGLRTERDIRCFLQIGAPHGPGFIDRGEHAWMRALLEDAEVSDPGERVRRLLEATKRKQQIEAENARILAAFRAVET